MAKQTPEILDLSKTVYVRKPFKSAGRNLLIGQPFDWKKLAVDQRRVRMMWEQRYLTHQEPETDEDDVVAEEQIKAHQEDTEGEDVASGEWTMTHEGFGRYQLFNSQGEPFQEKAMKKAEAEALIQDLNK